MKVLYLTDRLSTRGGADAHLRQVVEAAVARGLGVRLAYGRRDRDVEVPEGVEAMEVRGLAPLVASEARLSRLGPWLEEADVVHAQNVMNPVALTRIRDTGRAVITVQDHRVFCPAEGKTLPDGTRCPFPADEDECLECLPQDAYRERTLALTIARRDAMKGSRLIVLSDYMAHELKEFDLPGAKVIPPWVEPRSESTCVGRGFVLGGRLVAHKAIREGCDAWWEAGQPEELIVVGEGPESDGIHGASMRGWLDAASLRDVLLGARALLFPAYWQEPFGILGLEALVEGTPVIVMEAGGTGAWSQAGCVKVPFLDVQAMADAIRYLAEDDGRVARLGEEGRAFVVETFARNKIEPQLWATYDEVLASQG